MRREIRTYIQRQIAQGVYRPGDRIVETQLAREGLGIYLVIRLDCAYDGLRFVPLSPPLESGTVLAWKKTEVLSATAAALLRFAEKYVGGISDHPV